MSKKLTIAIAAHDVGGTGGMERHLEEIITRMKSDFNVTVVASTMKLKDAEGVRFIKIPVPRRPIPLKMILFSILASVRLFFLRYDILHTTGAIVFNRADFSTVHFCHHGYRKATGGTRARHAKTMLRKINTSLSSLLAFTMEKITFRPRFTRKLMAVSNRVKQEILHHFPRYPETDVYVVPNGVDTDRFRPFSLAEKIEARRKYGLPEKGTFILFMGGDWPLKGLEYGLEAFNQAAEKMDHLHFLVVGKGDPAAYQPLIQSEIRHRVHFVGKQNQPDEWFGMSDIFLFPSSYETFSLVTHEAAAVGLIILSTKVGGVEDFLVHEKSGLFIERDSRKIALTLEQILGDLDHYRSLGFHAREKIKILTWDHTYQAMCQAYDASGTDVVERLDVHSRRLQS